MRYIKLIIIIGMFCAFFRVSAQETPSDRLVTISETTHINDAVQILESFYWRYDKKKMINLSSFNSSIGVPINALPYKTALQLIALKNNLKVVEQAGYISLTDPTQQEEKKTEEKDTQANLDTKQVRINAVVMLADKAYLRSFGIDWSTLLNGSVSATIGFPGAQNVSDEGLNISAGRSTGIGSTKIQVNTLLRTIESNQKGTVLAEPNILVNSGKRGFIQVGQDFSVKSVDEAGNTTDQFFATGVIMTVDPTIVVSDSMEVIHLVASIERSSATPGAVSTIINKSKSSTELVLFDGEETVIGGLYDNDEVTIRSGIPILKDLPWWVFGIRYLTGYNKVERKERELVIILKVEIVEGVKQRLNKALSETAVEEEAAQAVDQLIEKPDSTATSESSE
ncbi:MAG: hypothetical protein PHI68_01980 [Candidatus Cloacimonetes bacterium]|nr:hypothetical protein [Candidatus Cloacimonadota bacterium]